MIKKRGKGYVIVSKRTHKVLGHFKSKTEALHRLRQIEYFKHRGM